MVFQLGIDRLLQEPALREKVQGKRMAFLGHPASVTSTLEHSLDALMLSGHFNVVAAFGPQHGMRGEKQDNMIESDDFVDPVYKIPVHSLYGRVRRPTREMMKGWDVLVIDLQDVGCRIYTFLTTLFYMMEAAEDSGQEIIVLDRPNPAGRAVEGHKLDMKYQSFVGAAPVPMRHGLTLGEAALWYREFKKLKLSLSVVEMKNYFPESGPNFGWPAELSWVNPSPNIPRISCTRIYPGSVLIEGTHISEGRGTTIPLEIFGIPGMNSSKVLETMGRMAEEWLEGAVLRPAFFEPTFHKFKGQLVSALQVHVDGPFYKHEKFKPYRLVSLFFKALHQVHPEFEIWKQPPYEYEEKWLPIEILSGHDQLKKWVEDPSLKKVDWDESLKRDEKSWELERKPFLLYEDIDF